MRDSFWLYEPCAADYPPHRSGCAVGQSSSPHGSVMVVPRRRFLIRRRLSVVPRLTPALAFEQRSNVSFAYFSRRKFANRIGAGMYFSIPSNMPPPALKNIRKRGSQPHIGENWAASSSSKSLHRRGPLRRRQHRACGREAIRTPGKGQRRERSFLRTLDQRWFIHAEGSCYA